MKILLIGPFPEPVTGESLANQVLNNYLIAQNHDVCKLDTSHNILSSKKGALNFVQLASLFKGWLQFWKINFYEIVYITPGQSFFGVVKYAPFIIIAKILKKKIVVHIHGGGLIQTRSRLKGFKRKFIAFILGMADRGIVLSSSLRANLSGVIEETDIFEISNFASDDVYEIEIDEKKYDRPRVLYLSNLMIGKGIIEVIKSFEALRDKRIEFRLAGSIESSAKDRIETLIKETNISYLGSVTGLEKILQLQWSNVSILPTFYETEGQPISIIEGMVAGNYIITTKQGGIPDIVEDKLNGSIINARSTDEIVEILSTLERTPDILKTVGIKNYASTRKKYRVSRFGDDIIKVLKTLETS
ncbi:glycosyltransferase family 4 protein [Reichenbachiella ulvae]|uniref:Glycosyltransferase family 4 protein n=1 Tax=Reichenbachiella ulvae TaxID=2980104 RepID=A0ABT3CXZ8_9BACT|nr:glycosyltransferase family 4 protein [Reichenbachiella ulvae]MCV9388492.1 glycosyltransferase family 4 protein [Reichenbachiella ulvae]